MSERRHWPRWLPFLGGALIVAAAVVAIAVALGTGDGGNDRGQSESANTSAEPGPTPSSSAPADTADTAATTTTTAATADTSADTTVPDAEAAALSAPLDALFPIGVDFQPADNFERWKARGINTLIRAPHDADLDEWADAATAAGLYQVRPPRQAASADIGDPLLLAWSHRDEPDLMASQIPAEEIQADYAAWKRIDPARPVLVNVSGSLSERDVETGVDSDEFYAAYFAGADWLSGDIYPVNRGEPLSWVGQMVDDVEALADGKPVFAYVESSDQDTEEAGAGRAPTPDELRGEVWHAIIRGARGIWYFPERIRPDFAYDATPDDVAASMPALHALITELAPVLQTTVDPPELSVTADDGVEVGWRRHTTGSYVIALNMSAEPRDDVSVTVDGIDGATVANVHGEDRTVAIDDGTIVDDFGPYEVHIYRVG